MAADSTDAKQDPAPAAPKLTVVVVDDSTVQRRFLRQAIEAEADFTVVGEARNGKEAVALVERLRPSAVLMDLDLPVMSGIEAIERIMASSPTPILVYSAFADGANGANALEALAAGAVDILAKPGPEDTGPLEDYARQLRRKLRVAARIRVITHPRGRLRSQGMAPALAVAAARGTAPEPVAPPPPAAPAPRRRSLPPLEPLEGVRLIVIGASTGGPQALVTVLGSLPPDLDQAVLIVQHMAEGFIPGLVSWLDQLLPLPVSVGVSGRRLQPGTITIAPSGGNLLVADARLRVLCVPPEPGQFHVPGIDATFRSVADTMGPDAVGVLLTGMGRDGAAGLLEMRGRGAMTLGQDEATSAVYGMPAAAEALHAVERQLPVTEIGPALLQLVGR
ncbi:MAG: chemotaxis-specific protein-glutamate methyltransferase CheB [Actinomycetota bacterium]|nr:chemotaxis-specific protein-glutamate methyltransferase CheB [Actinomycetota bacterium]